MFSFPVTHFKPPVAAGGGGFDFSSISGLTLWQDARDVSSITKDGSNVVSDWDDKSGTGNNADQASAGLRPTWVENVINGNAVMRFDGTKFLDIFNYTAVGQYTVFMVYQSPESPVSGSSKLLSYNKNLDFSFKHSNSSFRFVASFQNGTWKKLSLGTHVTNTPSLASWKVGSGSFETFQDGSQVTSNSDGPATTSPYSGTNLQIAANGSDGSIEECDIGLILIYNRALSSSEINTVHTEINNEWSLW